MSRAATDTTPSHLAFVPRPAPTAPTALEHFDALADAIDGLSAHGGVPDFAVLAWEAQLAELRAAFARARTLHACLAPETHAPRGTPEAA